MVGSGQARRGLVAFGALGTGAVALAALFGIAPLLALLVALGPLAIVPFGVALAAGRDPSPARSFGPAAVLIPVGALGQSAGFLFPTASLPAVIGASIYGLAAAAVGVLGLERLLRCGLRPLDELAVNVGLLLLPVGGVWLFASRAGISLLGFHEPIVLLTAAHFHYAGFAAPIVIGVTGRALFASGAATSVVYRIGALTVCAGVPLTALGIATGRALEAPAAVILAGGMLCAASELALRAPRRVRERSVLAAILLACSGITLVGTMALAVLFALTGSAGRAGHGDPVISISRMIELHGAPNAVAFALAGMVALLLIDPVPRTRG